MSEATHAPPSELPDIHLITLAAVLGALRQGWQDFLRAPLFGLFFAGIYVAGGLILWWLSQKTGEIYWLVIGVFGFPLLGPFAAVGLYQVSHDLEQGRSPRWGEVLGAVYAQKNRQIPAMCALMVLVFMFWAFVGHMIFAIFLGLSAMTNVMSSYEVFLTPNGLTMLAIGTIVGGVLAAVIFSVTVMGLPLLMDKEIDFVTAMIVSVQTVLANFRVMVAWGLIVALLLFVGMLPAFLGLLVVLPVLGHASWHIYRLALPGPDQG